MRLDVDGCDFGAIFGILAKREQIRRSQNAHAALPVAVERNVARRGDLAGDVVAGEGNRLVEVQRVRSRDEDAIVEGPRAGEGVAAGVLLGVEDVVVLRKNKQSEKGLHRQNLPGRPREDTRSRCCSKKRIWTRRARKRGPQHRRSHHSKYSLPAISPASAHRIWSLHCIYYAEISSQGRGV